MLRRFLRGIRDLLAATLQPLPISSRIAGPPKGFYRSFKEYETSVRDPVSREWPVLAPESVTLSPPKGLGPQELAMFRPLDHLCSGFSLFRIGHGRFHRDARAVLTSNDRILVPFSAHMGSGPSENWLFRKISLGRLTSVPGRSLLLVGSRNYYHFLVEDLQRIWLAREAGIELNSFDHILMFSPFHEFQKTLCDRVGIDLAKIIPLEQVPHVGCEELFMTTMPWDYGPTYMEKVSTFLSSLTRSSSFPVYRRIYISRERCTHGKITNELELMRDLHRNGFEKIVLETLPFDEQVALFAHSEIIIGAHGAGFTNLVFSKPECKVVEIRNPVFQSPGANLYWRLSQFLNLDYHTYFASPDKTDHRAPKGQVVDPARLPNMSMEMDSFLQFLSTILQ